MTSTSYSTIALFHKTLPTKGNSDIDKATFVTSDQQFGSYPVMSTGGWDDYGNASKRDVSHWYLNGRTGTYYANQTSFAQRPAL